MLSPKDPVDIDAQPTGLDYWIGRVDGKGRHPCELYAIYQGCEIVLYPTRCVLVKHDGRELFIKNPTRYKGRGWKNRLVDDTETAITTLKAGGGKVPDPILGELLRAEIARRGVGARSDEDDRTWWFEWLDDDELPILFGSWMLQAGVMRGRYEITRTTLVGFNIEGREFEYGSMGMSSRNQYAILRRLATTRGAPAA